MDWLTLSAILSSEVIIAGVIVRIFGNKNTEIKDLETRVTKLESTQPNLNQAIKEIKEMLKDDINRLESKISEVNSLLLSVIQGKISK